MRFRGLIVVILFLIVLGIFYFPLISSANGAIQVYAIISQGFLGFFSLAFTILFITFQLSPYSDIDLADTVFDTISVSYFIFLFVVIFFPLLMIALDIEAPLLEAASIGLAILAFIFFPIYFIHIREKLKPSSIATHIMLAVAKDIKDGQLHRLTEHIDFLFRITTKAHTLYDFVTVQHTLKCLGIVYGNIQALPARNDGNPTNEYLLQRISDLRRIFLDDSYSLKLILQTLTEIGQRAIEKGLPNPDIGRIMEIIELIPWQAINSGNALALQEAIRTYDTLLTFMSNTIYNKDYQSKLSKWYVLLGAFGSQNSDEYSQRVVLVSLRNHVTSNRIDYDVACQEALTFVQTNEYWELRPISVSKFIELWPVSALINLNKSKKTNKAVSDVKQ